MNTDKGYLCYIEYIGIKLHFSTLDFVWNPKYNYTSIKFESYLKRRDRGLFQKLHTQHRDKSNRTEFLTSSFLLDNSYHVSNILDDDNIPSYHNQRLIRLKSLLYTFNSEVENLVDYMYDNEIHSIKPLLKSSGELPLIYKIRNNVYRGFSLESMVLLDKAFLFSSQPAIDPLWKEEALRLKKYSMLIKVEDTKQYKTIINKTIT